APDRGPVLALDRPAQGRALARGVRAGPRDPDAAPGLAVGQGPGRAPADRDAQGAQRLPAAGRVPTVDVLRGPGPQDRRRRRRHPWHHGAFGGGRITGVTTLHDPAVRGFASDNYAGVHPEVLAAIAAANGGHQIAYGEDAYTARLQEVVRDHFGPDAE